MKFSHTNWMRNYIESYFERVEGKENLLADLKRREFTLTDIKGDSKAMQRPKTRCRQRSCSKTIV